MPPWVMRVERLFHKNTEVTNEGRQRRDVNESAQNKAQLDDIEHIHNTRSHSYI